jgi:hypothetical protein
MELDPDTTLGSLLVAIPSSVVILKKIGISTDGNEEKTLKQVCTDRGLEFQQFLQAMDEIDWNNESPAQDKH